MDVDGIFDEIVAIRRDLHQYPETEHDVERTAGIVAHELRKIGVDVREAVGKTGVVGDLKVPGAIETLAFRADMDALPMQEEGDLPYKSKVDGKAHMCGHDCHTSMLIGAARLIASNKNRLKRNIRFIFQPCEEKHPGGAQGMIEDGALDGVKEIYAHHVWPWLPVGAVGICRGPAMAQSDEFSITIYGKGGHAAAPQNCIDPILMGAHLITMLQSIVTKKVNPLDMGVLTVTQFHAGSSHNIIPSSAKIVGTVRTYDSKVQKIIKSSITDFTNSVTQTMGGDYEIDYVDGYPVVLNHLESEKKVEHAALNFLDVSDVKYPVKGEMFGEDFSYYSQKIPACFIQLGCKNEEKGIINPLHHPCFNVDENCMKVGMRLFFELAFQE
ncbi:MAG: amidohydrolase [Chlamydiota bacterium]|nr:amidohydrolase [Chlamydiota bacterium]